MRTIPAPAVDPAVGATAAAAADARRPWPALALLVVLAVLAGGCRTTPPAAVDAQRVRVGAGSTVEQQVLAALAMVAIEDAGGSVVLASDLGDSVGVRSAALDGDIDVFWDYTGAAWTLGLGRALPPADPRESFEAVQAADRDNGLRWLGPTEANATLALFVRAVERPPGDAGTISWLAGRLPAAEGGLCADGQYLQRASGYAALADAYAISTDLVQTTSATEAKAITSVAAGECFAALATATSGTAVNAGLAAVLDDQSFFPAFVAAPVVSRGMSADVVDTLQVLARGLDTATLAVLNAQVTAGADPLDVARSHLQAG